MPTTLEVLEVLDVSPSIRRVRFFAYDLLHSDLDPARPLLLEFPPAAANSASMQRTFTLLDFDARTGDLLVDFVLHQAGAPAAGWAAEAAPGHQLTLHLPPDSAPQLPPLARKVVLAGDATALPALTVLAAQLEPRQVADILVEVPSPGDVRAFASRAALNVEWLVPGPGDPRPLPRAVRKLPVDTADFWWVACEQVAAAAIADHLANDRGVPEDRMNVSVYWTAGTTAVP